MATGATRELPRVGPAVRPRVRKVDFGLAATSGLAALAPPGGSVPIVVTLWSSLRTGLLFDAGPFVLTNYARIVEDRVYLTVLANTLLLGVGTVLMLFPLAIPLTW